ncbi:phage gp6-like head-tail connector protein [Candidatus Symbiopectobacterium sp. NZEC127]|uniref:head-tail connector protein n=1 Tax=Candidatus Symbiopectobacterium sp. NZEC127 TaxID=2820472 RepID=UPI002227985E|nr:head-tail connector protein [Candidatus Symbiopectobacterium sp. NZEC127]MCW2485942.1 phage gp6-like head-tail connector protein [Candidatus Symbiopectobacterium sp. NZEC127]
MLDIDLVKAHCRVETGSDEDTLLNAYILAAGKRVQTYTRRKLYENEDVEGYAEDEDRLLLTEDVQVAMLLLIGHWYENREAVVIGLSVQPLPFAVESLLQPYRIYGL